VADQLPKPVDLPQILVVTGVQIKLPWTESAAMMAAFGRGSKPSSIKPRNFLERSRRSVSPGFNIAAPVSYGSLP